MIIYKVYFVINALINTAKEEILLQFSGTTKILIRR